MVSPKARRALTEKGWPSAIARHRTAEKVASLHALAECPCGPHRGTAQPPQSPCASPSTLSPPLLAAHRLPLPSRRGGTHAAAATPSLDGPEDAKQSRPPCTAQREEIAQHHEAQRPQRPTAQPATDTPAAARSSRARKLTHATPV